MQRIVSLVVVFALGCLMGLVLGYRMGERDSSARPAKPVVTVADPAEVSQAAVREEAWRMREAEDKKASDRMKKLAGTWISADGEKKATVEWNVLKFGQTPDWPDLEGRSFLLGADHLLFLTESGRYMVSVSDAEPDAMVFMKRDLKTESLSRLTLYREGSPRASSRPPLPDTPPPPSIQALLDLIPDLIEHESVDGVNRRMAPVWGGTMDMIHGFGTMGEFDAEFDLGVDGQWLLQRKDKGGGKLLRFRLVRCWVKDRREYGPDVERVIYPYYEFGKIITGPMKSHTAGEEQGTEALEK
ncbi:hypothetical protein OKA05_27070 [Luteolibacter arcticus]|uniref:DUF4340 domain-containing protein n=1 Tax=Luteolibacter arcticus TaxID=1581411 RepID=A0ABT3GRU6_9BACT|nr:hypothetical protein [Luteolibacter arcticus]MCW1926245.1 hypothetical protein [Luteolibacter arcticus]